MSRVQPVIRLLLAQACALAGFVSLEAHAQRACDAEPTIGMEIEYGDTITCAFEEDGDLDTYHFLGAAGDRPYIQVRNSGGDQVYKKLRLYDSDGELVKETPSSCLDSCSIDIPLAKDGAHTVTVEHILPEFYGAPAAYTLELPCLSGKCLAAPVPGAMGLVTIAPCRVVDTRFGDGGALSANETRSFHVYGDVSDQNNVTGTAPDGYPEACPSPLGEPKGVQLNVTVVPLGPAGEGGWLSIWPWNQPEPTASWMNYRAGVQNIANAGAVGTGFGTPEEPDISVKSLRNVHVIIDVLGYYTD